MKNNKGFISSAIVYSFFFIFLALLLLILNSYISNRRLVNTMKNKIIEENAVFLARHIIKTVPKVTNGVGLYYHNGSIKNSIISNGPVLDANDDSYRYAGKSPNNFVCFGTTSKETCLLNNENKQKYLYRIIGVFKNANNDYEVKLIKMDYAGQDDLNKEPEGSQTAINFINYTNDRGGYWTPSIPCYIWSSTDLPEDYEDYNTWSNSSLNTDVLNNTYLTVLKAIWANKIASHTYQVGGNAFDQIAEQNAATIYENEIVNQNPAKTQPAPVEGRANQTYNAKIGLMYVSDYMYGASSDKWTLKGNHGDKTQDYRAAINSNWLYMGIREWTITRCSDNNDEAFYIYNAGNVQKQYVNLHCDDKVCQRFPYGIRPVFYLKYNTTYVAGDGSLENPFIIS